MEPLAAANILQQNWISRGSNTGEIAFLLIFSVITSLILLSVRPSRAAFLILFFIGAWCASAYGLFLNHYFLPGAVVTFIVLPLVYLASTLGAYFVAWRKQQRLFRAFEKYLSPEMARRVAESKNALQLGGKRVVATAMFTDIQGFTSISETLTPEKVGEMLNDYFSTVMGAIFDNKGTLIKFIGDAVFALWGAPLEDEQHAEHAFLTALAITQAVERFNATGKYPQLHTRIGIHTGDMHVGNFGSHERFDFTALGDSVNFASRLEGLNKYLGTTILVSETSAKLLRETGLLPLGKFVVAGKSESISLYTILEPGKPKSVLPQWLEFLELLQQSRIEEAKEVLQSPTLRELIPLKTIERYKLTLSAAWSGAVILAEK